MERTHIIPTNDILPHIRDCDCACNPKVLDVEGEQIIIHNSWDGRELLELEEEQIN